MMVQTKYVRSSNVTVTLGNIWPVIYTTYRDPEYTYSDVILYLTS